MPAGRARYRPTGVIIHGKTSEFKSNYPQMMINFLLAPAAADFGERKPALMVKYPDRGEARCCAAGGARWPDNVAREFVAAAAGIV
jgi:hypothetical protein